uniref:Putative transposase n=1 Tax=Prochloron didemni P1-Palau TaxID=910450 RepID=G0XS41_PRODI|nr:putative transposase [Prochloron didemni P1-Palau]
MSKVVYNRGQVGIKGFALIVDDTGHRTRGNFTDGVVRQYIEEIGKTDNGIVTVTTHIYDGKIKFTIRYRIIPTR